MKGDDTKVHRCTMCGGWRYGSKPCQFCGATK